MDTFSLFPLNESDDPETFYLDPDRGERVHIPPGPPLEQPPTERLKNFEVVFTGYDEKNRLQLKRRVAFTVRPSHRAC
jgi:hypothetical protein